MGEGEGLKLREYLTLKPPGYIRLLDRVAKSNKAFDPDTHPIEAYLQAMIQYLAINTNPRLPETEPENILIPTRPL